MENFSVAVNADCFTVAVFLSSQVLKRGCFTGDNNVGARWRKGQLGQRKDDVNKSARGLNLGLGAPKHSRPQAKSQTLLYPHREDRFPSRHNSPRPDPPTLSPDRDACLLGRRPRRIPGAPRPPSHAGQAVATGPPQPSPSIKCGNLRLGSRRG